MIQKHPLISLTRSPLITRNKLQATSIFFLFLVKKKYCASNNNILISFNLLCSVRLSVCSVLNKWIAGLPLSDERKPNIHSTYEPSVDTLHISRVQTKPVFECSDQIWHELGCTNTDIGRPCGVFVAKTKEQISQLLHLFHNCRFPHEASHINCKKH